MKFIYRSRNLTLSIIFFTFNVFVQHPITTCDSFQKGFILLSCQQCIENCPSVYIVVFQNIMRKPYIIFVYLANFFFKCSGVFENGGLSFTDNSCIVWHGSDSTRSFKISSYWFFTIIYCFSHPLTLLPSPYIIVFDLCIFIKHSALILI